MEDIVRNVKVYKLLGEMIRTDNELFGQILDTPGFAKSFNDLVRMACGKDIEETLKREPYGRENKIK